VTSQRATISRIGGEATAPFGQYETLECGFPPLELPLHHQARLGAPVMVESRRGRAGILRANEQCIDISPVHAFLLCPVGLDGRRRSKGTADVSQ
jgi:hypothetical protein